MTKVHKGNSVKRWMKIVLAAVAMLAVPLAAIPFLVNANTFRPMVETELSANLGRQVTLGNLTLSVFIGSLKADELSIADDPDYSRTAFLKAQQLRIRVKMLPLIFSRRLEVLGFALIAPDVHLVRGPNGTWNFSSIRPNQVGQAPNSKKSSFIPDLTAQLITIEDGRAVIESLPATGPPRVFEHLNLSVKQFSLIRQFSFNLSASLPGNAQLTAIGNAGPINLQDAARTPMDIHMLTKHLDPVAGGLLDPSAGLSLLADIEADAMSDGKTLSTNGRIHMEHLQLRKGAKPAPNAIDLDYKLTQRLQDTVGQLKDATLNTGRVALHLRGTYQLFTANPMLNLKLSGEGLPIDELQVLMTAAGVTLPHGAMMKGGTLNISLLLKGQANALTISGPVELTNTEMVGYNLASKIHGIASLGGLKNSDTTSIQKLQFDLRVTNAGVQLVNIQALLPSMGELSGSGTVSPTSLLGFRLTLNVTAAQGIAKRGVSLLTKMNEFSHSGKTGASKGVPLLVTGTPDEPVITADVSGLLRGNKEAFLAHFAKKK